LNRAIDDLVAGAAPEDVLATLPADLRPLATAGARLAAARAVAVDGVRPAFVLALEEQLRTDLRLRNPRTAPDGGPARAPAETFVARLPRLWLARAALAALALAGIFAVGRAAQGAHPGDPLYGVKRALESAALAFTVSTDGKAEAWLDIGWRRLQDVAWVVDAGPRPVPEARLRAALGDVASAYNLALAHAGRSAGAQTAFKAQGQTQRAYQELQDLAGRADPGAARLIRRVSLVLGDTGRGEPRIVAMIGPPLVAVEPAAPGRAPVRSAAGAATPAAAALLPPGAPATPTDRSSPAPGARGAPSIPSAPPAALVPTQEPPRPTATPAPATREPQERPTDRPTAPPPAEPATAEPPPVRTEDPWPSPTAEEDPPAQPTDDPEPPDPGQPPGPGQPPEPDPQPSAPAPGTP